MHRAQTTWDLVSRRKNLKIVVGTVFRFPSVVFTEAAGSVLEPVLPRAAACLRARFPLGSARDGWPSLSVISGLTSAQPLTAVLALRPKRAVSLLGWPQSLACLFVAWAYNLVGWLVTKIKSTTYN